MKRVETRFGYAESEGAGLEAAHVWGPRTPPRDVRVGARGRKDRGPREGQGRTRRALGGPRVLGRSPRWGPGPRKCTDRSARRGPPTGGRQH